MSTPLSVLALSSSVVEVGRAVLADLEEIVALLADDPLGSTRDGVTDNEDLAPYRRAFALVSRLVSACRFIVLPRTVVVPGPAHGHCRTTGPGNTTTTGTKEVRVVAASQLPGTGEGSDSTGNCKIGG